MILLNHIPRGNQFIYPQELLESSASQTHPNLAVALSNDCSSDEEQKTLANGKKTSLLNLTRERQNSHLANDANLRQSLELGSGDLPLVQGNGVSETTCVRIHIALADKSSDMWTVNAGLSHVTEVLFAARIKSS